MTAIINNAGFTRIVFSLICLLLYRGRIESVAGAVDLEIIIEPEELEPEKGVVVFRNNSLEEWKAPEEISKNFVYYLSGHDDEGRPIWVAECGKWPTKEVVEGGGEMLDNLDTFIDQMGQAVQQSIDNRNNVDTENPVTGVVAIIDMENYSLSKIASLPTINFLRKKLRDLYPVAIKIEIGYLVNMNFVSENMVNVMRPILGPVMAQFQVFGSNKEKWLPHILRSIPRSQLPHWYGGTEGFKPLQVYG